jgi:hypothetical protein
MKNLGRVSSKSCRNISETVSKANEKAKLKAKMN